ncbi:unnamed protein product [Rhizoctonia solani]|uniref:Uncharacterized protein n=1 Tax=Rhizoctonia solani TaxID=456999 RepID=A0A8H3GUS9_9AGAM|nr:unnamed protein product [Rhizoctonia solani]
MVPHTQNELDLNEGDAVAEPFVIQAADNVSHFEHTPKMRSTVSNLTSVGLSHSGSGISMPTTSGTTPSSSTQLIRDVSPITGMFPTPAATRKVTQTRGREIVSVPAQEQDAGVSLSGGLSDEHATLPPAYDSSWRM